MCLDGFQYILNQDDLSINSVEINKIERPFGRHLRQHTLLQAARLRSQGSKANDGRNMLKAIK